MYSDTIKSLLVLALVSCVAMGCTTSRKAARLRRDGCSATLSLPGDRLIDTAAVDSIRVTDENTGEQIIIMKAELDENGEMVARDEIQAATVTARFRNVAERSGSLELRFQISVPSTMIDRHWQVRFSPRMKVFSDTLNLDPVIITGGEYRKAQLRGYQQYERWLNRIVSDSTAFIDRKKLEIFLRRNLPQVYRYRTDSSYVSDEEFESAYGVTQAEAVNHYTDHLRSSYNDWLISRRQSTFRRLVKVPIEDKGLRLDTVVAGGNGDFDYEYVQTLHTRPGLRKVEVILSGSIYDQDKRIYTIPDSEPLTFYISSLSAFVDSSPRYMMKIVERRVEAHTECMIGFGSGSSTVDETLPGNMDEIGRIKRSLSDLLENVSFDLDSIVVCSSASPEGGFRYNRTLSVRRSEAISRYFDAWMDAYRDSLDSVRGFAVGESGEIVLQDSPPLPKIRFVSRSEGENWKALDVMVEEDVCISAKDKEVYRCSASISDADKRENAIRKMDSYRYLRQDLYPRLRAVSFSFHLHRKGMVKDTVHTTVPDTVYMSGVQAIRDSDYRTALTLLQPYKDYNCAVAYCAMGYDASALSILEQLERSDKVLYLLAILYSRKGDDQAAVQSYVSACSKNPSYIHRGNLDPEISKLIKRYELTETIEKLL